MKGNPDDPISFGLAVRELWARLASDVGYDLRDSLSRLEAMSAEDRDELGALEVTAQAAIFGLIQGEGLRVWAAERGAFRRIPPDIKDPRFSGDSTGLYLDRTEIATIWYEGEPHDPDVLYPSGGGPKSDRSKQTNISQNEIDAWCRAFHEKEQRNGRKIDWSRGGQAALEQAFPGVAFKKRVARDAAERLGLLRRYHKDK